MLRNGNRYRQLGWQAGLAGVVLAFGSLVSPAHAGAIIYNNSNPALATVALGVNDEGHLNFNGGAGNPANASAMGLSYRFQDGSFRDATAPGCLCEGWGVAVTNGDGFRTAGFANQSAGSGGLGGGSFSASTTRATSQTTLSEAPVVVTHAYGVSLAANLFQGNITITNTGGTTLRDVVYRRAMDWDVPNTEFQEFVTHQGVLANLESAGGAVRFASTNGFASSDPRTAAGGGFVNQDFVAAGPSDHGSVFDFAFGNLAAGESRTFNIYYGAAADQAGALAALRQINADVYSLGQSLSGDGGPAGDAPTFIFAFGGVGTTERGSSPDNPILPIVDVGTGVYEFPAPIPRQWYDPPFAKGFAYSLAGEGVFTEVGIPVGFGDLEVELPDGTRIPIAAGGTVDFESMALAPRSFKILGLNIDTGAPDYDALRAFPTFLDFSGSPTSLFMAPILEDVEGRVPVPGTLFLFLPGLLLLLRSRRAAA